MAKKFFNEKVHNTKRTIINSVIIGVCVIGIIICFAVTTHFKGKNKNPSKITIKNPVTVEVNEDFSKEMFFSQIENYNLKNIKIKYPNNYNISKIGQYKISIIIDNKKHDSTLNVIDTNPPELSLKNVSIKKGENYNANNFVEKCVDNSNQPCLIQFYNEGIDEDGNKVYYDTYKDEGTYPIKIVAQDESKNQTLKETTLIIGNGKRQNKKCKYGNNIYNTDEYTLTVDVTVDSCAVSLDLYKDEKIAKNLNQMMNAETKRIKKDVEALNLTGTLALNRKVTAIVNKSGDGIVGYELKMTVTITDKETTITVADYILDKNSRRIFNENPYDLNK